VYVASGQSGAIIIPAEITDLRVLIYAKMAKLDFGFIMNYFKATLGNGEMVEKKNDIFGIRF
jgi:hypothetical protein